MNLPDQTIIQPVMLTQPAADAVRDIMVEKNLHGYALRLFISGGGCSGYQYGLAFDSNTRSDDLVIEANGVKLIIDEVSIKYLQGATVDYVEGITANGFKIINPNASSTCGCGQSFDSDTSESSGGCSGCG